MKTSKEIRNEFLNFFEGKGHKIISSAPVIPQGDPTLLFTNAGMNQFKEIFLAQKIAETKRIVDTQKCIRVSGKHNDLEEVGVDTYHHTFFEMLGNWSFGDYYKKEAIAWAWELLTDIWKLDKNRLFITVYKDDDEAFDIWKDYIEESRILRFGDKDNFWEMGETGPCGPCSEIHYDNTINGDGKNLVNMDNPQVIEIWNLVFIQYNRNEKGELLPLKNTHVDTGMGLERITRVIQNKNSNYDTDLFLPLINKLSELSGIAYKFSDDLKSDIAMRVISDHIRALSFSIADGAIPGNEGRSYVLRRILRRASRFARELGFDKPILYSLVDTLTAIMGDYFKEIIEHKESIKKIIKAEEESFLQTLDNGLSKLEEIISKSKNNVISGSDAFLLYDSFGFPLDLTSLIAREKNYLVDEKGFESEMLKQKERSRANQKSYDIQVSEDVFQHKTEFKGYELFEVHSKVLELGENFIILDETPFYVESGGQISDTGKIIIEGKSYNIIDTKKKADSILHITDTKIIDEITGKKAFAVIDIKRRKSVMRNHSATHLLHEALRQVLGEHIRQQGSLVTDKYLRFDFNHFQKVNNEEITKIERIVNDKIFEGHIVSTEILSLDEAKNNPSIKMYFGDKYGDMVRAVKMGGEFSTELCGGTHVANTAEIGLFKIIAESSVASGVRRIEAITGRAIEEFINQKNRNIDNLISQEKSLNEKIKLLEKEIKKFQTVEIGGSIERMIEDSTDILGTKVISELLEADNKDLLTDLADKIREKGKNNLVALLSAKIDGKVLLVCTVTDDLKNSLPAGKLVGEAAKYLGGGGGGKPHLATAGAKDDSNLDTLLKSEFYKIVTSFKN